MSEIEPEALTGEPVLYRQYRQQVTMRWIDALAQAYVRVDLTQALYLLHARLSLLEEAMFQDSPATKSAPPVAPEKE